MILVSHVELVRTSLGALIWLAPFVEIDLRDWLSIEHDRHSVAVAGDDDMIPLADGLHSILPRLDQIVKRAGVDVAGRFGVIDCDLDPVVADVFTAATRQRHSANE